MQKQIVYTDKAPAPIGPYSQAVAFGNLVFTSGQIAIDPATGQLVTDNVEAETRMVMENVKAVLAASDLTLNHVLKTTIFLSNMDDFPKVNVIYGSYFDEGMAPARETVQVARLPKGMNVEISVIAGRG
jgi:2-iminobutanoate/2-iminopropanoate deaminase